MNATSIIRRITLKASAQLLMHVGKANFDWMIDFHGGDHPNLTFANLLINANYKRFVEEFGYSGSFLDYLRDEIDLKRRKYKKGGLSNGN